MDNTNTQEAGFSDDKTLSTAELAQGHITVNREGSGHTLNCNGTIGSIVLGIIALILLRSLLRAEARNRELQAQLSNIK